MCTPGNWCCLRSPQSHHWCQRSMLSVHSSEVNNNLLRLLHIQREIVVTAPPGQAAHLAPVVYLISVANETQHSRVIRKFNEEVGVVWRLCSHGSAEWRGGGSAHILGGPLCSVWCAGCVYCRPVLPEVSRSESPTASCTATYWAPAGPVYEWAVEGWIVLNAELKSMNSILTFKSFLSKCVRALELHD